MRGPPTFFAVGRRSPARAPRLALSGSNPLGDPGTIGSFRSRPRVDGRPAEQGSCGDYRPGTPAASASRARASPGLGVAHTGRDSTNGHLVSREQLNNRS